MTIQEVENFYKEDNYKYIIKNNNEFLNFYKCLLEDGYKPYLNYEDMQEFINKIANWYEVKYPDKLLEEKDDNIYLDKMDSYHLKMYLNNKLASILDVPYRSKFGGNRQVGNNWEPFIAIRLPIKESNKEKVIYKELEDLIVYVNPYTGIVYKNYMLEDYNIKNEIYIDELLNRFKNTNLDLKELELIIKLHKEDIILRNELLSLIPYKLLYSKNTSPELGYERAKKYIFDINKYLKTKLDIRNIEEIINRNYNYIKEEKNNNIFKKYTLSLFRKK